ncbi:phosphonate ABC transporter, permease protein PhnE [Oceanicola sp. D3]|uniref:phosphonate ABC transporter, permease protein PhnE n=1 Tax=Oceanicola sp. D3 TaxID=2587163 RepID=UPI0011208FB2|nr:phosphonate ABC transporter, permease protein PhnE [Oceanicola sp. D3]QDC08549.1 phosphonate ABC transporter, permease protein PhnE [Oceanicola sp. D3]
MDLAARYAEAEASVNRKTLLAFAVPGLILLYFVYIFFAFDVPGLIDRARPENAQILLRDTWSYKTHVTRDNRNGEMSYAVEGERKGAYPEGERPEWVSSAGEVTVVDLGRGRVASFLPGNAVELVIPGERTIEARLDGRRVVTNLSEPLPDYVSVSNSRLQVTLPGARLTFTRSRTETFRYFGGWELFFFTLDSPYHGHGLGSILFGEQIDPARGNLAGAWHDFWQNPMWMHAAVAWAMFETVLMAFLGTFGAALISLPIAFLAAKNFAPLAAVRFAFRRVFDFLRGVDGLIWTIVLSRAFGPGPLTGSLAILLTDTGSFGKMFSEALENVDKKQIEGVASTGAARLHRYRFGVIPQVAPVLLSQVLYYLESNTRSATIIGAITGGGIGLLLTQAMITQKDWEEVTYYIVLVVLMVMAMDSLSGWLRRRLIRGD